MEFRRPLKTSEFLESFLSMYRMDVHFIKEDCVLHNFISKSIAFMENLNVDNKELFG